MPRNKSLMRVFKDLDMVEYLGSGMPRILKVDPREAYTFSSHFIRTTLPMSPQALAMELEVTGEPTTKNHGLADGLVDALVDALVESQQRILILVKEKPRILKRGELESGGLAADKLTALKFKFCEALALGSKIQANDVLVSSPAPAFLNQGRAV